MRNGNRRLLVVAVLSAAIVMPLLPVSRAAAFNQRLEVHALVAPMRAVYINQDGNIIKIAGNTSDNVEPRVIDSKNQPAAMTVAIMQQYDQFLKQHGGHLEAGKAYSLNTLAVDTAANNQQIIVGGQLTVVSIK